ncbi:MAG TPA: family 10 glycosylhydrolase [Blastocatellia bacterium]|nr:family 10 glycosylhydrolase [Blastocatellia bacterium]
MRNRIVFLSIWLLISASFASAQSAGQYRAFWVDTFNSTLNNHNDVVAIVNNARAASANAIFAQVRRRGDSWYLNSLEPAPDFVPIAAGFDPLRDLIAEAHANGIEVHAFVIIGAVWNKNPNFAPTATLGPPTNPNHVFNLHGGYNPATQQIVQGPNNWLTRTLLPDGANNISFQGHRFGSDFWLDLGHPDAAAYTAEVLQHLVINYDIDGLHLDRIRYPEISISGQTPSTGTNIGYNETSVARFQRRHGIPPGSPPPEQKDPLWNQWRRDQVSNLVRRVYLNAIAVKPDLKVSAALIVFGGGPTTESGWNSAEAYWRVYQDWRAWTQEGILDIAMPMNYKSDHTASQIPLYDRWNEWAKNHQYNRSVVIGNAVYLNAVEGSLRQARRALAPSGAGNGPLGVILYSMATTNAAVTGNPFSIPAGQNTPVRPFAELAAGLTTGRSANGATLYEDPATNPTPVFGLPATIPTLAWKASPTVGHLMGFAKRSDGTPLDTATVTIENLDTHAIRAGATDGGGFYGGVDLAPGRYLVKAELGADVLYSCAATVAAGTVAVADLGVENVAPASIATVTPALPSGGGQNGQNDWFRSAVTVTLSASDNCSGVARIEFSTDGGATWETYTGNLSLASDGVRTIYYRSVDNAGNVESAQSLTVRIDQTAPAISLSADPSVIWPPNGKSVPVTITGSGADAVSGLAAVSYVVTDEYGTPLAIPLRQLQTMSGVSAAWTDQLSVEARRDGEDLDGRVYQVVATITDVAGNTSTATVIIRVPHDQR